jgi:hypothetical protein
METILVGLTADLMSHKVLAVRALVMGWAAVVLVYGFAGTFLHEWRLTLFSRWGPSLWGESEILRQLWVYYGLPFVLVTCVIFMAIGWLVAGLHRRQIPGIVVVFAATLLIPATLQAMETRRLLATDLWPGWGWGSFRWALLFQTALPCVVYPLCVVIGGLWTARTEDGDERPGNSGAVLDES